MAPTASAFWRPSQRTVATTAVWPATRPEKPPVALCSKFKVSHRMVVCNLKEENIFKLVVKIIFLELI